MNEMPAKVNRGEPCSQAWSVQSGSPLGSMCRLRWRTAMPLGRPVVPEVYMMSARSSSDTGTWKVESSEDRTSTHWSVSASMTRSREGTPARASSRVGRSVEDVMATTGPAWPRTAATSREDSRVLVGTATAPALWMAA